MADAASELEALGRLGFDELGGAMAGIGRIHAVIADRAFGAVGPLGTVPRAAHDAVARRAYGGLRAGSGAAGRAAGRALCRLEAPALSTTRRGATALGVLSGFVGDQLERDGNALQAPMAVRVAGTMVAADRAALAAAFPGATPRLVVFLHGLMETEHAWTLGRGAPYGARLAADLGCTPVDVRYNTGRHVSENGRSLSELLDELVAAWPVEVEEIALVGHSMGGLVARSACHRASEEGGAWVGRVRHVVTLGTPHLGAPLAQAVHWLSSALGAVPEGRAFGAVLRRRSAGIRDLRQGSLVDEDWRDRDPEALRAEACREVPLLHGATHCFVSATLTRDARHPLGRLLGDALVLAPSAAGRGRTRRIGFRAEDGLALGGAHHLALLNHPAVYEQLRRWLRTPPPYYTL